jgi:hypothetical protein
LGNLSTPKSVQKLQTALHAKAKAEAGYRFYALYDKISREDILAHAYAQCRGSNKGAPGVDGPGLCRCAALFVFEDCAKRKLQEHGVGKVIPNETELARAYRVFARGREAAAIIERELTKFNRGTLGQVPPGSCCRRIWRPRIPASGQ